MLYIFGYGSLLYPPGINGRTPQSYDADQLHEAWLFGYRREWSATWNRNSVTYLGIVPDSNSKVNGVIFQLEEQYFQKFAVTEASEEGNPDPMYNFVDVRTQIGLELESDLVLTPQDRILTCVTAKPNFNGVILKYYVDIIHKALQHRGLGFKNEFMKTTLPEGLPKHGVYENGVRKRV